MEYFVTVSELPHSYFRAYRQMTGSLPYEENPIYQDSQLLSILSYYNSRHFPTRFSIYARVHVEEAAKVIRTSWPFELTKKILCFLVHSATIIEHKIKESKTKQNKASFNKLNVC